MGILIVACLRILKFLMPFLLVAGYGCVFYEFYLLAMHKFEWWYIPFFVDMLLLIPIGYLTQRPPRKIFRSFVLGTIYLIIMLGVVQVVAKLPIIKAHETIFSVFLLSLPIVVFGILLNYLRSASSL